MGSTLGVGVYWLLTLYMIILAGRAVLSWFPVRGGTFLASLNAILFDLTEPVLRPVRRMIPPIGMFDTSFIVVFFAIVILRSVFTP
jgi:YggT family protein